MCILHKNPTVKNFIDGSDLICYNVFCFSEGCHSILGELLEAMLALPANYSHRDNHSKVARLLNPWWLPLPVSRLREHDHTFTPVR